MPGGSRGIAIWTVVASAAIAIAASGCGGSEEDRPPGRSVAAALTELQGAFEADDFADICMLMTPSAKRQAGNIAHSDPTTCQRDVAKVIDMIDRNDGWEGSTPPRLLAVTGGGPRRMATVVSDDGWKAELPFKRLGGRWRLDGFFGIGPTQLRRVEAASREQPFPAAGGGGAVEIAATSGTPCPAVSTAKYPEVSGGCLVKVHSKGLAVRMLTPFGDFKFGNCSVDYDLHVDGAGRTWMTNWEIEGAVVVNGCSDIDECIVWSRANGGRPWKGRLIRAGGGYLHEMNMCLRTCVGRFSGTFASKLDAGDVSWRFEPSNVGATGFRFDGVTVADPRGIVIR